MSLRQSITRFGESLQRKCRDPLKLWRELTVTPTNAPTVKLVSFSNRELEYQPEQLDPHMNDGVL